MKLYEYIDECIQKFGIRKAFGVPGSLVMPIWQNIKSVELVLCSHEQEASYLATGYSKMFREPTVVITTGGPGVTNCISGIAAANLDSLPLIYISGRTPVRNKNHGLRQEESDFDRCYDSNSIMSSITKKSICITNIEDACQEIYDAFQCALSNRMGSVHISIPIDMQQLEVKQNLNISVFDQISAIEANVDHNFELIRLLKDQKRCLLIIGWGCWLANVTDDIYRLAEKINAPILCTVKAYCCMKKNDFLIGKLGYGYNKVISKFVREYKPEEVLVFGSSISIKDFTDDFLLDIQDAHIHSFSIENNSFGCGVEKIFLHKVDCLKKLFVNLDTIDTVINNKIKRNIYECKYNQISYYNYLIEKQKLSLLCKNLSELLDNNITITADAGNHLLEVAVAINPKYYKNLFLDDGIRAMGSGICETVGMAFADKNRHYIAVTGDGCMLMNGNVMYIAMKYSLPIVFLVINNSSLGRVRVGQMSMNRIVQSDLGGIDFVCYAKTFGIEAHRVSHVEECIQLIKKYLNIHGPTLIEMNVSNDEIPIMLKAKGEWN